MKYAYYLPDFDALRIVDELGRKIVDISGQALFQRMRIGDSSALRAAERICEVPEGEIVWASTND